MPASWLVRGLETVLLSRLGEQSSGEPEKKEEEKSKETIVKMRGVVKCSASGALARERGSFGRSSGQQPNSFSRECDK